MKIKMLETRTGSENGVLIKTFYKGELYEVVDDLGNAFVNMKVALKVDDYSKVIIEPKMMDESENKSIKSEEIENKSVKAKSKTKGK